MKESSWRDCLETKSSLSVSKNLAKAKSLIDTAVGRNNYLKENRVKEENANYIFEGYYSSLLELVHALLLLHGFKVTNHVCLGFFLRDVLSRDDLFRLFDDCRFKRNSLVYYGRKMDYETCQVSRTTRL